jgi:hypothetical protein
MKSTKHEFAIDYLIEELQVSETYEDFVLSFYIYWCESITINAREFQKVIANASINRWFMTEFKKLEQEFKYLASQYPQLQNSTTEMDTLQARCFLPLMSIHPQILVSNAKKKESKSKPTAMPGLPIDTSILHQN